MTDRTENRLLHGVFVGLSTLDVLQLVDRVPTADDKVRALALSVAAGGPAANAAVVFAALGGRATLVTRIGADPVGTLVRADLTNCGVRVVDAPGMSGVVTPVASILVTRGTGERAVVSAVDQAGSRRPEPPGGDPADLAGVDVVLVDSYERDVSGPLARRARALGIPVLLDCGEKKEFTESQLPDIDIAVVAEGYVPGGPAAIAADLRRHGVPYGVSTAGGEALSFYTPVAEAVRTQQVPQVRVVDTLGAGDFFHGALAYAVGREGLSEREFPAELAFAADIASRSVQEFGSRSWLRGLRGRR